MRLHRVLASATLAMAAAGLAASSGHAQNDPAGRALAYLASVQRADGSIDGSPGETEDLVLGAVAAGDDPAAIRSTAGRSPLDALDAATRSGAAVADAGRTGKLVLAVVAAGRAPTDFGGRNLLTSLAGFYTGTAGAFGTGDTFTQSLAILGLHAATAPVPPAAVARLHVLENGDGSWNYGAAAGARGDTNSTAIALMALDALGDHTADAAALTYLRGQQNADGGFPYQSPSPYGTPSDPDSDALVVQAITATGGNPAGCSWARSGGTPLTNLLSMQDPSTGGFTFPGNPAPDAFTTSEVPAGLALQPLPVSASAPPGAGPAQQQRTAMRALRYLATQQAPDGSIGADPGATEDLVLGAASAGYDPATLTTAAGHSPLDFLAADLTAATSTAGRTAKLVLAVTAAGGNPHRFAGHDLVALLEGTYAPASGAYGDGATFGQSLAILAESAAGRPVPATAVAHLLTLQDSDGSWNFTAQPNAAGGDSNSTAVALVALAAAGQHGADASALAYLHGLQNLDGGFGSFAGSPSDPDSGSLVLQALVATFQDPAGAAWSRGGATVVSQLLASQDRASGGYVYPGSPGPDAFTTSQVPEGLERVPAPVLPAFRAGTSLRGPAPGPVAASHTATPACGAAPTLPPTPTPTSVTPAPTPLPSSPPPPARGGGGSAAAVASTTTSAGTATGEVAAVQAPPPATAPTPVAPATPEAAGGGGGAAAAPTRPAAVASAAGTGFPAWAVYALAGGGGVLLAVAAGTALTRRRGG